MTGPQHYQEAERLVMRSSNSNGDVYEDQSATVLAAQVHATLALAAATVVTPGSNTQVDWLKATS